MDSPRGERTVALPLSLKESTELVKEPPTELLHTHALILKFVTRDGQRTMPSTRTYYHLLHSEYEE